MKFLSKILGGDPNEKFLKGLEPIIEKINNLEKNFEQLSDSQLKDKTREFKERYGANDRRRVLDLRRLKAGGSV